MIKFLVDPPHPSPLPPPGGEGVLPGFLFYPLSPMIGRVRKRGKEITYSLLSINALAYS
jgi:hypothetical protein